MTNLRSVRCSCAFFSTSAPRWISLRDRDNSGTILCSWQRGRDSNGSYAGIIGANDSNASNIIAASAAAGGNTSLSGSSRPTRGGGGRGGGGRNSFDDGSQRGGSTALLHLLVGSNSQASSAVHSPGGGGPPSQSHALLQDNAPPFGGGGCSVGSFGGSSVAGSRTSLPSAPMASLPRARLLLPTAPIRLVKNNPEPGYRELHFLACDSASRYALAHLFPLQKHG